MAVFEGVEVTVRLCAVDVGNGEYLGIWIGAGFAVGRVLTVSIVDVYVETEIRETGVGRSRER